jgi:translation initiation factor 1 (eIF-1/SUI1)
MIYHKKELVKAFKKKFAYNCTIIEHPEYEEVIQLQVTSTRTHAIFWQRLN